ncbi:methionyl-tRNA formyltransferase [Sodalis-like secondary symbiont of Drepanosiphum platanoidis]|uniref:methionyl-tRNA formyltransferase n=1 Tax=Sodalis-like secondary symbiont of Drepanosiphum platanoidis TaxID=2994493 RepID=UPI003463C3CD
MKKLRIFFAGTRKFAESHLKALINSNHKIIGIFTKNEIFFKKKNYLFKNQINELAIKNNIPIFRPKSLLLKSTQDIIKFFKPDIIVVVSYGLIFPKNILNLPPLGCINVHASLLPKWRGAAPIQRSLLYGDKKTGITIIQMNSELDSGNIINQIECNIKYNDTSYTLLKKLKKLGSNFLIKTLNKIYNGNYSSVPQDIKNISYANKINKKEAKINWNLSAKIIDRYIRSFNPWPVSYFISNEKEIIKIFKLKIIKKKHKDIPGKILYVDKKSIQISTGSGIISPIILQPENKKIMFCRDFLNSRKKYFFPGIILKN